MVRMMSKFILDIDKCTKTDTGNLSVEISDLGWKKFPTQFYLKDKGNYFLYTYSYKDTNEGDTLGVHYYSYRTYGYILIIND